MRCELVREYDFEAAHRLPNVPDSHKCARMHGHSYRVTIRVEGEIDPDLGWLVDFGAVDEHVRPLVAQLDHRTLNEIQGLENPTSELLAVWLWQRLHPQLPILTAVEVSETPTSRCIYRGS
jgi:6-pyruvoyltetrahydropterin/6-carboxytetrahydropterin synthase